MGLTARVYPAVLVVPDPLCAAFPQRHSGVRNFCQSTLGLPHEAPTADEDSSEFSCLSSRSSQARSFQLMCHRCFQVEFQPVCLRRQLGLLEFRVCLRFPGARCAVLSHFCSLNPVASLLPSKPALIKPLLSLELQSLVMAPSA